MKRRCLITCILLLSFNLYSQQKQFGNKLSDAAIRIINPEVIYDPNYQSISYPNGDIDKGRGVCTDVVIRAYRELGIDLQKEVHEDMKANFNKYPSRILWGLTTTDKNIDHRRVPNLQIFFGRKRTFIPKSKRAEDYQPGDIVTWNLPRGLVHIGIVIDKKSEKGNPLVVHNLGMGQIAEDILFSFEITGHYRYQK